MGTPSHRLSFVAFPIGAAIALTGVLFTLGVAAADRTTVAERFDAAAASTALAIESELDAAVHLLHGALSLTLVQPDLTQEQFDNYFRDASPVPGVIGWGAIEVDGDSYVVSHFHSDDPDIDWLGTDLARKREMRESIFHALQTGELTATSFAPMTDVPSRSALLLKPHAQGDDPGLAFAIVNADLLGGALPPELAGGVTASLDQSTQLSPRDVAFRGMSIGFGNRLWSLTVVATSPAFYPGRYVVPLGFTITALLALLGGLVAGGIAQRRRLRAEVFDNERINQAREQFIASVSHEIRTPLTAVVGYAELLNAAWGELADDEAQDMVRQILEQSHEVSALVKDLLVGSRADISTLHLEIGPVRLREVTERALASIPSDLRRPIDIGFDDDRAWLADPGRATQIIRNLVVNSLKYGGEAVTIESRRLPGTVVLSVVDDGDGIAPEHIERLFQPFSSIARNARALPSVGLGLYVSASLARAMGGSLSYRRQRGLTAFDLELPAASATVHHPTTVPVL